MEVVYFDGPGRADTIRILLHALKGEDWTDTRFDYADWSAVKAKCPLGAVPTLKIEGKDGTVFCQSVALQRYLATQLCLYPKDNPFQALIVDEVMDSINECMEKFPYMGTEEEKETKRPVYQKNEMTMYFGLIETRIQAYGGGGNGTHTTTVCGVPSVADIYLMATVQFFSSGFMDYLDVDFFSRSFPGVTACVEAAAASAIVKNYHATVALKKKD